MKFKIFLFLFFIQFIWAMECKQVDPKSILNQMDLKPEEVIYKDEKIVEIFVVSEDKNRKISIPTTIVCLQDLTRLVLRNVQISEVSEALGLLPHLYELDLSKNKVKTLPNGLKKAGNLRILHLEDNEISRFPQVLLQMPKLQELNLKKNHLQEIPWEIKQMKNLVILNLSFNRFYGFPGQVLVQMENLRELYWLGNVQIHQKLLAYINRESPQLEIYLE